ncbi:MAG: hypothetical protein KKE02_07195 [Alphaproteobacteria bacterium]|nr:hypothetical protein [Alphaproteobacteria bacterium]MBU1515549.1 hypothetical protein [Alphaproteobacteria bacterium]MBU2095547.1 hypothetical protein [Alphaproteobacteria bacterium]MBU2150788.1 hypothetical protein [Alphaproteobacteria bacterium]MBU2307053.1 hypothetical protein [Alphaproteobacteria bacterium]
MTPVHPAPEPDDRHGLFQDALADWTNDDVLQTKEARTALGAKHPAGLRVLDWPELRALFAKYDPPATRHGRRDRRFGLVSVGLATLGLVLALLAPLAIGAERYMEMVAAALTLAGLGLMAFHEFGARVKARWLGQRFGAERVRGLYFQAVANNLNLVARAMANDAALGEWKVVRGRLLSYLPKPEDLPGQVPKLAEPPSDDETWVLPAWSKPPPAPEPSPEMDLLLSLLRGQRLDGQVDYVQRKLSASLGAPGRRAAVVRGLGKALLAAAAMTAVIAGVLLATGKTVADTDVQLALAVTIGAIVATLALRVVNDDRLLAGDAGRYAAYFAAVSAARTRFDRGDLAEKLAALREMEMVAYRDLRAFVAARWRVR